jgi:hypothetical protein
MKRKSMTWVTLGILSCFFVPVFVANWLYNHADKFHFSTNNHGSFVKPMVSLDKVAFTDSNNAPFSIKALSGKWVMAFASKRCYGPQMLKHMYYLRQLRIALGTNRNQVVNTVLMPVSCSRTPLVALKKRAYPKFKVLRWSTSVRSHVMHQFAKKDQAILSAHPDAVFFIDPQGRIMMRFPANASPKAIHQDMAHLVRLSHIG